jgi:hypothetical protein
MTTATLEREELLQVVRDLPDDKLAYTLKLVRNILDENEGDTPNEETIKVLKDIEAGRNLLGPYPTLEAMFKDFGIDVDSRAEHCVQE